VLLKNEAFLVDVLLEVKLAVVKVIVENLELLPDDGWCNVNVEVSHVVEFEQF
jgi:hypothetical protein